MESNITKEIIYGYFAGTCTALQKNLIEAWVKEDANREVFYTWLYEWEKMNVQYQIDVESGIERHRKWVRSLNETEEKPVSEISHKRLIPLRRLWVAASFLVIFSLITWFSKDILIYKTYETAYGEILKVTLPDGSKVVINANSVFRVPRFGFGNKTREVYLAGEASFDVVHTSDNQHFLVVTDKNMNVEVLGTAFNVYARSSGSRVVLNEGKIKLHYTEKNQREKLIMKPGDLATMDASGKVVIAHTSQPQNYSAWKYHRFVFEDQAFREICDQLEETFGNQIVIENQTLANQIISGSFTALDADELLEILREAGNFRYSRKDNKIIITTINLPVSQPDSLARQ